MDIIPVLTHWLAASVGAIIGIVAISIVRGGSDE